MATKVDIQFNGTRALKRLGVIDGRLQMKLATAIIVATDPYVPKRDGFLKNSAQAENGGRQITYGGHGQSNKYARRLWYGDTYNFNGAPVRGSRWVDRAWAVNGNQIIGNLQNEINKGGIK